MELVAGEALVFVIALGIALAIGRELVVLLAGLVIVFIAAIFAAVGARGDDNSLIDFSPSEAFTVALLVGLGLYAGWALGVAAAALARFWATRRRDRNPSSGAPCS